MIRVAGSVAKSWLAQAMGASFDHDYYFDPTRRHAVDRQCNRYVARQLSHLNVFYTESNLGRRDWYDDEKQVLIGGIQPNMILGMLLGAEFLPTPDADADIAAHCLAGRSVGSLPPVASLLTHPLVGLWERQIRELAQPAADRLEPIPPFFWDASGRAAVHGAVTTGLKFWGDEFLLNLVADPPFCQIAVEWLTDAAALLVRHFAHVAGRVVDCVHVGECAACMLDVDSFRAFVVPAASRLGQQFGSLRFHSCGRSDHLIEACQAISGLSSLDVGGETSVVRIRAVFGRDFPVGIAPLVEQMRDASTAAILQWFARVCAENEGGDMTIGFHLEAGYNLQTIVALHEAVAQANV